MQCIGCCQGQWMGGQEPGSPVRAAQECVDVGGWKKTTDPAPAAIYPCEAMSLRKGELYSAEVSKHCRITCTEGAIWVTSTNRFCDYILKSGESLLLQGKSKVIVSGGREGCLMRICYS